MKWFICIVLSCTFLLQNSFAQDYNALDKYALEAPRSIRKDLPKLTTYLLSDFKTDKEKVRSFYTWIIHNIDYDQSAYKRDRKRINRSNTDILDRRQAVCFGYSTLFKEMCLLADIPCEIISGYAKNQKNGFVDLTAMNHAWNAVKLDNEWYLMDLTWGQGNNQREQEQYFLCPPEELILTHLPADPMWQFLDCPIKPGVFRKSNVYINAFRDSLQCTFSFRDSIDAYESLLPIDQKLSLAMNSYRFNPVVRNKEELGHSLMDAVALLSDRSAALELTDSTAAIKAVHLRIIGLCSKAEKYIELYDHQKENLAYSHINYATALSKEVQDAADQKKLLDEMLQHFKVAKTILQEVPQNFLVENALVQIEQYINWVEDY